MGCSSSKRVEVSVSDVYHPPPSSFSVFDVYAIEEPWIQVDDTKKYNKDNPTNVPAQILEKLNAIEDAPRTWDEVSKALEDLKPTLHQTAPAPPNPKPDPVHPPPSQDTTFPKKDKESPSKSVVFHTLEELDAKLKSTESRITESKRTELKKPDTFKTELKKNDSLKNAARTGFVPEPRIESEGYKPVRENIFLVRDKLEREKEGKPSLVKFDPLSDYPEICPPGGADTVVLYTTSLGGVRRTYEDCNKVRSILEVHRVVFDERDVSLHGEFLNELKELVGEGMNVPRIFVRGRYLGGVEEVVNLNETSRLGRMMNWARVERGMGRLGCEGCGGARFIPCLDCGGSCKVVVGEKKERCLMCNENGLVHCPICL